MTLRLVMGAEKKPDFKKAQEAALALLDEFGYEVPPIDPVIISRELGIRVYFVEFEKEDDNISGFFSADENAIYVNKNEYAPRQTFTIAHELGHKRLHEEWLKSSDYKVLLRDQSAAPKDPIEQEANVFAAHLLVPKFILQKYKDIASIQELATLFMVSEPVIRARLKHEYGK